MTTATRPTFTGASRGLCLLAVAAGLLLCGPAFAQNPIITATYQGAGARDTFAFKWKEKGQYTKSVGTLHWDVPVSQFGTSGLDRAFDTYCAEALVPIHAGKTYRFEVQSPETPEAYGLPDTEAGRKESVRRTSFVRELFGRQFLTTLKVNEQTAAKAFQVALWEVMQESSAAADVANPFDLFDGNFRADYPNLEQAPAHVKRAQDYLKELTGNDSAFYENPALAGRELVYLKGLPNENGEVGQSQLALRYVSGGVGGGGGASGGGGGGGGGLLGGGGVGGGGGGAPLGGFGGSGGGLGGIGTNSGNGSTGATTSTTPASTSAACAPWP